MGSNPISGSHTAAFLRGVAGCENPPRMKTSRATPRCVRRRRRVRDVRRGDRPGAGEGRPHRHPRSQRRRLGVPGRPAPRAARGRDGRDDRDRLHAVRASLRQGRRVDEGRARRPRGGSGRSCLAAPSTSRRPCPSWSRRPPFRCRRALSPPRSPRPLPTPAASAPAPAASGRHGSRSRRSDAPVAAPPAAAPPAASRRARRGLDGSGGLRLDPEGAPRHRHRPPYRGGQGPSRRDDRRAQEGGRRG